ncbi:MAG TPA: hydroxyethylthiazole kinase [Symbiobacteriaceae bacterium]|jgi:thiamine-phosphate pyrophosphorylase
MSDRILERLRMKRPLVHAITNYVSMDWVARGLLAAGARPVMALDKLEAGTMASVANALYLNMGTWSPEMMASMVVAGKAANAAGVPVVFDPVGAGGLPIRTEKALELLEAVTVTAIRGNAGEIAALAGITGLVRGVDTAGASLSAVAAAVRQVARKYHCVAAATGEIDLVSDGTRTLAIRGGHPLMTELPGTGCLVSALVAAGLGAAGLGDAGKQNDPLLTVAETLLFGAYAGEVAAAVAKGPGSFTPAYLDALATVAALPEGRIAPPLEDRLAVYVIVSGTTPLAVVQAALTGGAGTIQFREKHLPLPAQVEAAKAVQALCREAGALFLVNDRVDLALAIGADGVHVGQDDLPVAVARRLMGPQAIIGASCETGALARIAAQEGADYVGTGPVYATPSKADAGEPTGTGPITEVAAATALPVVGIGGIGLENAASVIKAGACGVSVISAVVNAADPGAATRALLAAVNQAKVR